MSVAHAAYTEVFRWWFVVLVESISLPPRGVGVLWRLAGTVAEAAHERHKTAVVSGVAQEGMLQQFEGVGTLTWIAHQHAVDEALQARRHLPITKVNMRTVSLTFTHSL